MKKIVLALLPVLILLTCECSRKTTADTIDVMSMDISLDSVFIDSTFVWSDNAMALYGCFVEGKPDLLGIQDASLEQFQTLDSALVEYGSVGVGSADGGKGGLMNPLFYKKERFDMVRTKTFWLSDMPDSAGSVSWNATSPHVVTWIELVEKNTQDHLFFFNTSFSGNADSTILACTDFFLRAVDSISSGSQFVITGEFNVNRGHDAYEKIIGPYESVPMCADTYVINEESIAKIGNSLKALISKKSEKTNYVFVRNGISAQSHDVFEITKAKYFLSHPWCVETEILF